MNCVKNLRTLIIVVLILTVILSVFVGCMNDKEEDIVTITHIALGKKLQNTDEIIDRVNERMRKEIGIEINVKFVPRSKYNSLYEGNEYFDSIFTAEHLDYWENVAEGYFAPISEKELREYAPNLSKISPDVFETGEYQGKTYAIPSSRTNYNMNCWVLRGDFMDKYGIKDIKNLDDIEAYLKAVKENETDIIPFNVCAEEAYCLLAAMTVNRGWENPGPSNAMSPVQISTVPGDENYLKLFNVLDTPEMLEFSERMKRWREMGFWPDTALETKVPACESILGGRSALAWMNLVDFEHIKKICNRDNRKNWDLRVFYTYSENPTVYSNMISATAQRKRIHCECLTSCTATKNARAFCIMV